MRQNHIKRRWEVSYLLPGLCAVGLASAVDRSLILAEMHQRDRKTSKVWHVVVQQLCSVVHFVVEATIGNLHTTRSTRCTCTHHNWPQFQIRNYSRDQGSYWATIIKLPNISLTPLLWRLHWLRAPECIAYKLAMLVYRCLHGLAPAILGWCLTSGYWSTRPTSSSLSIVIGRHCSFDTPPDNWWSCFSGSCITDMELTSAGSHVVKNAINI